MATLTRLLRRTFSTTTEHPDTTNSIRAIFKNLSRERNLKNLVQKFKSSSEIDRFRTKSGIYESIVRRLASAKRFRYIEDILEEQKKYYDIQKEGFNARLISLYGKSGMFENANKVFDEMPERNCARTVLSMNTLLAACVNSRKFDKIEGLFRELPGKLGVEPDLVTYNTVIKGFCDMGSLDGAVGLLDEMEEKGVEPDMITFNTLLNPLYVKGNFSEGEKVWGRMMSKNVEPDIRTCNAKLFGLALEKRTKEAVELLEDMKSKGVKPDMFSMNALIKGFVKEGDLQEAKRWYGEIGKSEFDPDKKTFSLLVPFACVKGDVDFAVQLCRDIININCSVEKGLLQLVVDRLVKESKGEEAKKLVQLAKANRYRHYKLQLPSDV